MLTRTAYLRRARHWIANRGVGGLVREIWYRLGLVVRGKPLPGKEKNTGQHPFDRAYGVDTTGLVWGEALTRPAGKIPADSQYWATGYYGIAPSALTAALETLKLDWPRYTFVDVGCGKGRALMLAMRYPFRRVLGVELSQSLVEVANANLQTFSAPWRLPLPAQAIAADATSFPVPDGSLLLFLYHPFAAPVMKRFFAHLKAAASEHPRDILLLYANPELASQIESWGDVARLWRQNFPLSPEDGTADRFGSHDEIFAAYRLRL